MLFMSTFIILNRWVVPYKQKAVLKVWLPHVKKNEISIQCCYNCVTWRKLWSSKTHTEFRYTVLTEIHWKICPTLLLLSVSCYFSSSKYSSESLIFFFFSLFPFNINAWICTSRIKTPWEPACFSRYGYTSLSLNHLELDVLDFLCFTCKRENLLFSA